MPGPLQVIAVSFGPGADFEGRVLAEVDRLQGRGVLRLLDVLFVAKSEDGVVERLVVGDDEDFGALLASIVPFDGAGLVGDGSSGFDPADAWALAGSLAPGTALAFLLVEHGWAQPLFDAIAESGGVLVGEGFLTPEVGLLVGAEVAAMEEAARVIAAAQADEADTMLLAMAAETQAVEAIATSEAIRTRRRGRRHPSADHRRHRGGGSRRRGRRGLDRRRDHRRGSQRSRDGGGRGSRGHGQGRIDHDGSGEGPPLPAHAVELRGHRRQAGDLPRGGEGTSRARLQEARGTQPQPKPSPEPVRSGSSTDPRIDQRSPLNSELQPVPASEGLCIH